MMHTLFGGGNASTASENRKASGGSTALNEIIRDGAERVAKELDEYIAKKSSTTPTRSKDKPPLPDEAIADLQLATARKIRELLPTQKDLLFTAQEQEWIPVLLSWLNLHDRPAVQVEALLALTNIAEMCAQQSYYQQTQVQNTPAAAAAKAAAAVKAVKEGRTRFTVPGYPSLVTAAPGSVPFPPLSFSQTLSPEAVAAFDASLTSTIQNSSAMEKDDGTPFSLPPAPLFPSSGSLPSSFPSSPTTGGINFTSLAPPPGGPHTAIPNNSFLPPPTPVIGTASSQSSFPQQLSPSSQHLLLRHADAIPTLISLLSSPNKEVYEQSMWILGSIAVGDSPGSGSSGGSNASTALDGSREKPVSARDVILAAGVMNQLLRCLETHPENLSLQRIGSWTLSNLVEGIFQQAPGHGKSGSKSSDYSSSDEIDMKSLLPVLRRLLNSTDSEVLTYTCWTLSHLCDGPSSHIAEIVSSKDGKGPKGGLVPRLVELLLHPSWRVTKPALRTIGNIVCAECSEDVSQGTTTDYTEVILECEAVPRLKELISHSAREIQKEACWTLSNIAAGSVDQIQAVIDSNAIPPLMKMVEDKTTDQEVRSEACWVVLNATSCGSDSQIEFLVGEGCVSVLALLVSEATMVSMALEGLERVLQVEQTQVMLRQERIDKEEIKDEESNRVPVLVSASLIEKARRENTSTTVSKRIERISKQHFVRCALCKEDCSKHRKYEQRFCGECKCYVCMNCNCQVYHLSYQEELWAETEEKTEQKKSSKKSKNKKKKEKAKQKKKLEPGKDEDAEKDENAEGANELVNGEDKGRSSPHDTDGADEGEDEKYSDIDFVQYLQQTGSIIALARLMDLEYGEENDEDVDDSELQLIREQQLLSRQTTT